MTRGKNNKTPSVSPIHHENQFEPIRESSTTPNAVMPPSERVALVMHSTGTIRRNLPKS